MAAPSKAIHKKPLLSRLLPTFACIPDKIATVHEVAAERMYEEDGSTSKAASGY